MTTFNVSCPHHIGLLDLFPRVFSLYTSREMVDSLTPGERQLLCSENTVLDFDCQIIIEEASVHQKNPEYFLPWCFLRCVEAAGEEGFSVSVICSPENWHFLASVWPLAWSIHKDRDMVHCSLSVSTLPAGSAP